MLCALILEPLKAADVFRAINADSEHVIWHPVTLGWQAIPSPALIILLDTSEILLPVIQKKVLFCLMPTQPCQSLNKWKVPHQYEIVWYQQH